MDLSGECLYFYANFSNIKNRDQILSYETKLSGTKKKNFLHNNVQYILIFQSLDWHRKINMTRINVGSF